MFSLHRRKFFVLVILLLLIPLACNMPGKAPEPTDESGALYTIAAQTLSAEMTQTSQAQPPSQTPLSGAPSATPGQSEAPSSTPEPPTATVAAPTNTPFPTSTPTDTPCDKLVFVDDITIEDGTEIEAGEPFEKIWRLKNAGSCTWTAAYNLVFVDGHQMDAPDAQMLTADTVAPGQEIDVTVSLTAPDTPGKFRGNFKLQNPAGVLFGGGVDRTKPFWVDIKVPDQTGLKLDFLAQAKHADWGSGVEPIDFANPGHIALAYGGPDTNSNGFAMIKDQVELENGKISGKILETHPKWEDNGYIVGKYPLYEVGQGDLIRGRLGFLAAPGGPCLGNEVIFEIHYTKGDDLGTRQVLGSYSKACTGNLFPIEIDLTPLVGEELQFYLVVRADGPSEFDWAIWSSLGVVRE